jgi:hypothetical protein
MKIVTRAAAPAVLALLLLTAARPAHAVDTAAAIDDLAGQITRVAPQTRQIRIGVTDFVDQQGVISDYSRYVSDRLSLRLATDPRIMTLDRGIVGQILRQLKLKRIDLVTPEKAKLLAKGSGLDIVVVGGLTEIGDLINLEGRVIDVGTGETLGYVSANVTRDAKVGKMLGIGRE